MNTEETLKALDTLFQYKIGDRVYPAAYVPAIEARLDFAGRLSGKKGFV